MPITGYQNLIGQGGSIRYSTRVLWEYYGRVSDSTTIVQLKVDVEVKPSQYTYNSCCLYYENYSDRNPGLQLNTNPGSSSISTTGRYASTLTSSRGASDWWYAPGGGRLNYYAQIGGVSNSATSCVCSIGINDTGWGGPSSYGGPYNGNWVNYTLSPIGQGVTAVTAPTNVKISPSWWEPNVKGVTVTWTKGSNGTNNSISRYDIYFYRRSSSSGSWTQLSAGVNAPSSSSSITTYPPNEGTGYRGYYYTARVYSIPSNASVGGNKPSNLATGTCRMNYAPSTPQISVNNNTTSGSRVSLPATARISTASSDSGGLNGISSLYYQFKVGGTNLSASSATSATISQTWAGRSVAVQARAYDGFVYSSFGTPRNYYIGSNMTFKSDPVLVNTITQNGYTCLDTDSYISIPPLVLNGSYYLYNSTDTIKVEIQCKKPGESSFSTLYILNNTRSSASYLTSSLTINNLLLSIIANSTFNITGVTGYIALQAKITATNSAATGLSVTKTISLAGIYIPSLNSELSLPDDTDYTAFPMSTEVPITNTCFTCTTTGITSIPPGLGISIAYYFREAESGNWLLYDTDNITSTGTVTKKFQIEDIYNKLGFDRGTKLNCAPNYSLVFANTRKYYDDCIALWSNTSINSTDRQIIEWRKLPQVTLTQLNEDTLYPLKYATTYFTLTDKISWDDSLGGSNAYLLKRYDMEVKESGASEGTELYHKTVSKVMQTTTTAPSKEYASTINFNDTIQRDVVGGDCYYITTDSTIIGDSGTLNDYDFYVNNTYTLTETFEIAELYRDNITTSTPNSSKTSDTVIRTTVTNIIMTASPTAPQDVEWSRTDGDE
jgi:hypothetical protein